MYSCNKFAFVGVMNEYFSFFSLKKWCHNLLYILMEQSPFWKRNRITTTNLPAFWTTRNFIALFVRVTNYAHPGQVIPKSYLQSNACSWWVHFNFIVTFVPTFSERLLCFSFINWNVLFVYLFLIFYLTLSAKMALHSPIHAMIFNTFIFY